MMSTLARATGDVSTEGHAEWVTITIRNLSNKTVVIRKVGLELGKFYKDNNKESEILKSAIEGTKITTGSEYKIYSCGRQKPSSTGTKGNFEIFVDGGQKAEKIGRFNWDCPGGTKKNIWAISDTNKDWKVEDDGANTNPGALGDITVKLNNNKKGGGKTF